MRGVRDSTWPFCLDAVQRPAARPDPSAGSWVRALVCSARPVLRRQGHSGPRSHLQARRRRPRQVRLGVYGLEDLSPASAQFAAEAVLTAYTLMACGRGRGRRLQRHHRREMETLWSRRSPAPPPSAARRRKPKSPAPGRRSGRGRGTPPCRPTVPSPMARRAAARHRSSRLGNWETVTRRTLVGTDKKVRAHGARTA